MPGTRVTCEDIDSESDGVVEIRDNYVLITDGSCYQHYVQSSTAKDGTQTHVITVKGIKQRRPRTFDAADGL